MVWQTQENDMMDPKAYVQNLVDASRKAQEIFAAFSQEQVDAIVRAAGKAVYDNAESLARLAVQETGMGRFEDKVMKNKGKSKTTWYRLRGVKSRGVIRRIPDLGLVEVAHPMGVIGAICPMTNPTMTPMHNAMVALKGGNSLIVCPHPKAKKAGVETVRVMNEAIAGEGAPENLIQVVSEPTMDISGLVMALCDMCISTGGAGMVKAAYSSGKPAFGVGQGNVQVLIDRNVELADVADKVITGRAYDLGVLCTCEQCVICPEESYNGLIACLQERGAYYIEKKTEVDAVRATLFPGGTLNRESVGLDAVKVAAMAGIAVPASTRILVVKLEAFGKEEELAREKLCPVMAVYAYKTWEEAVHVARSNLLVEGTGHSAIVHSRDSGNIDYAALRLPVSRIAVNQTGSNSLGGTLVNGLNPTGTLGCGSWGNNGASENLWFHHLINISRVASVIEGASVPTDEEIWAK
jgi:succinate-semialdehyde dehydrogenase